MLGAYRGGHTKPKGAGQGPKQSKLHTTHEVKEIKNKKKHGTQRDE